jgi:hypothetical protein
MRRSERARRKSLVWHDRADPCATARMGCRMIVIAGLVLGAVFGAASAAKGGGKRLDMLQYAAAYGIAFGLLGVVLTIIIERAAG